MILQTSDSTNGTSWDLRSAWSSGTITWWQLAVVAFVLVAVVIFLKRQDKKRALRRRLKLDARRQGTSGGQAS